VSRIVVLDDAIVPFVAVPFADPVESAARRGINGAERRRDPSNAV
jgi:hypothetical protein